VIGKSMAHLRDSHRRVDAGHARFDAGLAQILHEHARLAVLHVAIEPCDAMFQALRQPCGDLREHGRLAEARRRHDKREPRCPRQRIENARGQPFARNRLFEVDDWPELQLVNGGRHEKDGPKFSARATLR
jgi:hypothetical protein